MWNEKARIIVTPSEWDASPSPVTPQHSVRSPQQFPNSHSYSRAERSTVRVKYLAREDNVVTRQELEPEQFDPNSSAITI